MIVIAGMGPPPKPAGQRARRNATVAMTTLPSEGRAGRVPPWPLIDDVEMTARHKLYVHRLARAEDELDEERGGPKQAQCEAKVWRLEEQVAVLEHKLTVQRDLEKTLWRQLWRTPQAAQWQTIGWYREVAQYVRWKVLAELGELDASKEARQLADRLGLTPLAMLRLRWQVAGDDVGAKREEKKGATSSRERYKGLRAVGAAPPADA